MWGVAGVVAVLGVAACGGERGFVPPPGSDYKFEVRNASCAGTNDIVFDVEQWVVLVHSSRVIPFTYRNGDATVKMIPVNPGPANWPFEEEGEFSLVRGQVVNRTVKAAPGSSGKKYRFKIEISCGGTNPRKVTIDPDIFVD